MRVRLHAMSPVPVKFENDRACLEQYKSSSSGMIVFALPDPNSEQIVCSFEPVGSRDAVRQRLTTPGYALLKNKIGSCVL